MASETKNPVLLAAATGLGIVSCWAAIDTRVDTLPLADFQAIIIARRTRLAPAHARLIAEHAFFRRYA